MRYLLPLLLVPAMAFAAPKKAADSVKAKRSKAPLAESPVASAGPAIEPPVVEAPSFTRADPNARGVFEFTGDPIDVVLRVLARKANINIALSPSAVGSGQKSFSTPKIEGRPTGVLDLIFQVNELLNFVASPSATESPKMVNLRLEDKTAREAFDVICQVNDLVVTDEKGILFVKTKFDQGAEEAKDLAHRQKLRLDAYVAEGFTRSEAMQFLLNQPAAPAKTAPETPKLAEYRAPCALAGPGDGEAQGRRFPPGCRWCPRLR